MNVSRGFGMSSITMTRIFFFGSLDGSSTNGGLCGSPPPPFTGVWLKNANSP